MTKATHAKSHVYVMSDGHAVKVGVAGHVETRRKMMQGGNPRLIVVVFVSMPLVNILAFTVEKEVHRALAAVRLEAEWFAVDAGVAMQHIERCIAAKFFPK
jgi:hypothetical protein